MEAKTNYTLVGVLVLILTVGLLSTGLWLSVGFNQKKYIPYTVYLNEAAGGLAEDAAVKYNGVQVGFVKEIKLNKSDPRQVEIILNIEEGTPITTSTSATLISQGITGVAYVGLSAGSADLTPLQTMPGEPYPVIPARPSLFNQLDSILKEVSENVNKIGNEAQRIFNDENALSIKNTLANMDKISSVIAKNNENINHSIKNADEFLLNLSKVSKDFPQIAKDLKLGVAKFNNTMNTGQHAIETISQQALPPIIVLLRHLNNISANLEDVSAEFRQNPSVLIRGTAPKRGPGE